MSNPKPIVQEIKADYDDQGLKDAARDTKAMGDATEKSGKQSKQASRKARSREDRLRDLRARLVELVRAEDRHEKEVAKGVRMDERATLAADRRRRQIDRVGLALREERRIQARASQAVAGHTAATNAAATSSARMAGTTGALAGQFKSVGASLLGAGGLIAALGILGRDLEERTRQTREFLDANLELQFLSTAFNEQEREFLTSASIFGGRDPSETVRAFTQLKSRFPGQGDESLQSLFLEILETSRTTTASLTSLTDAFSGLFQATGNAQAAQNILRETIIQAGQSDPAVITPLLGKFLGPGTTVLGLTAGESAGGVAGVTGLTTQRPEEQVQGLLTFLLNIKGKGTPEINEILTGAGLDKGAGDAFEVAARVLDAVDQGRISSEQFETLTGREGIKIGSALLDPSRRRAFFEKVQKVAAQEFNLNDPTADAISEQFGDDSLQSVNFAIKQAEAEAKVAISQDQQALENALAKQLLDNKMRSAGKNAVRRFMAARAFDAASAFGADHEIATLAGTNAGLVTTPYLPGPIQPETVQNDLDARAIRNAIYEEVSAAAAGQIRINKVEFNHGTIINQAGDPARDDLEEGRPFN